MFVPPFFGIASVVALADNTPKFNSNDSTSQFNIYRYTSSYRTVYALVHMVSYAPYMSAYLDG